MQHNAGKSETGQPTIATWSCETASSIQGYSRRRIEPRRSAARTVTKPIAGAIRNPRAPTFPRLLQGPSSHSHFRVSIAVRSGSKKRRVARDDA
jgi:hypothetical protein